MAPSSWGENQFCRNVAQYAKERAMTIAMTAPASQIKREAGPRSFALSAGTTKMSAPIAEPTTRLVVSNVFSCLLRVTFLVKLVSSTRSTA